MSSDRCEVPLANGKGVAIVSPEDHVWAMERRWNLDPRGYARTTVRRRSYFLHRLLLNAPKGVLVDHINGEPLDCRRENLRLCNAKENARSRRKHRNTSSRFKGVTWHARVGKWQAVIVPNGRMRYLGLYVSEEEAGRAYDRAAVEEFGAFAKLNFPEVLAL